MGWFRRRRRSDARVVFLSVTGAPVTPAFTPRPVEVEVPPPSPEPGPRVRLGFVDGSEICLSGDDPAARALIDAAEALRSGD